MSEWISVDDRLPEIKGDRSHGCLVYTRCGSTQISFLWSEAKQMSLCHNAPFEITDRWHKQESRGYKVTHWMPLPQPPQSKEQEEK